MHRFRTLAFLTTLSTLLACGGAGDLVSGAEATLTATPSPVGIGQPITVTWGGHRLTRGKSNDFGADTSLLSGSIQDRTAVDIDYHISMYGKNGDNPEIQLDATATATVIPSTKNIVIFGDPAVAGPNQMKDYLQTVTTGTVRVDDASGTAPVTEDLIVLHSSLLPKIDALTWQNVVVPWLNSGKSVMLIGEDLVKKLANNNVSSIGGYLGGGTGFSNGILPTEKTRAADGIVPISIKFRNQKITLDGGGARGMTGVGGSADIIISTSGGAQAFAYKVSSGGKTAFCIDDGVGSSTQALYHGFAIRSMARWCLDL